MPAPRRKPPPVRAKPKKELCERCNKRFADLDLHEDNSPNHHICDDCGIDFGTWHQLEQHFTQSKKHHFCRECERHFKSQQEFENHAEQEHFYCIECKKFFKNASGMEQHFEQSPVHKEPDSEYRCEPCNKDFFTEDNLREVRAHIVHSIYLSLNAFVQHWKSRFHRERKLECPFDLCSRFFIKMSDLFLHLESGKCPSGTDFDDLDKVAQALAAEGLMEHEYDFEAGEALYMCPDDGQCDRAFTRLSAYLQHVETEICWASDFQVLQKAYLYV